MGTDLSSCLAPNLCMTAADHLALERNFALKRIGISRHATSIRESANSNRRSAFSAFTGDGLKMQRARVFEVGNESDAMRVRIGVRGTGLRENCVGLGSVCSGLLLLLWESVSICRSATAEHLREGDVSGLVCGWHGSRLGHRLETRYGASAVSGCGRASWRRPNRVCKGGRRWKACVWWRDLCSRRDLRAWTAGSEKAGETEDPGLGCGV